MQVQKVSHHQLLLFKESHLILYLTFQTGNDNQKHSSTPRTVVLQEVIYHGFRCIARISITPGTNIMPFQGKVLNEKPSNSGYPLKLNATTWAKPGGERKTVNHSCNPKAFVRKWTQLNGKINIFIVALTMIPMGTEITIKQLLGTIHGNRLLKSLNQHAFPFTLSLAAIMFCLCNKTVVMHFILLSWLS